MTLAAAVGRAVRWICCPCGQRVCRATPGLRLVLAPPSAEFAELLCRDCKRKLYLSVE